MRRDLDNYIDSLLANGRYTFTRNDLHAQFGPNDVAIRHSLRRLNRNDWIKPIRNGFFSIIPPEYRNTGTLPPDMFIDKLMNHLKRPYYVGLLSAAALHGAGHQQPQQFFVITNKPAIRPVELKNLNIRFCVKSQLPKIGIEQKKTPAGYIDISSPELTALDLMTYPKQCGGITAVTAVLEELTESMTPENLTIPESTPTAALQRLGYVLEEILQEQALADAVWNNIQSRRTFHSPLNPAKEKSGCPVHARWKIIVNTDLESEL